VAVGPVRALLGAHLQAAWNRSRRELGARGRVVYVLVIVLVGGLVLLPALGGSLMGGYLLGQGLPQPGPARILGAILGAIALMGGLAGGVASGSRVLAWEATQVFPVKVRKLFAAELVAGLGEPLPLIVALASACLLLGAGAARPRLFPLLPLPWLGTVAAMLCLQRLVGSLAARVVNRLRVGLMLLAFCAWAALNVLPAATGPGPVLPVLWGLTSPLAGFLGRFALLTPPLQSSEGLREAALGNWGRALARQAYPMAALAMLFLATAWNLGREADPQFLRAVPGSGQERSWTFRTPARGVGRLHWQNLITSHLGKAGFLVPLMVLVVLRGPASLAGGASAWKVPAAFAYLALAGMQMQLNQFGLDGPGVKTLLLLPLHTTDLLAGKALGLAAYMGTQTLLLLAIMALAGNLQAGQVLPALCLSGCLFLYQVGLGHWTSAWLPRPMPRTSLRNHNLAGAVVWLGMAASLLGAGSFGGLWLLLGWLAPGLLAPVLGLLFGGMFVLYRTVLLPAAAAYLETRKEALVQALGRPG